MFKLGYAIIDSAGGIDVRTVSPTRLGSLVNWLHYRASIPIYDDLTNEVIEEIWNRVHKDYRVGKVQITEMVDDS